MNPGHEHYIVSIMNLESKHIHHMNNMQSKQVTCCDSSVSRIGPHYFEITASFASLAENRTIEFQHTTMRSFYEVFNIKDPAGLPAPINANLPSRLRRGRVVHPKDRRPKKEAKQSPNKVAGIQQQQCDSTTGHHVTYAMT